MRRRQRRWSRAAFFVVAACFVLLAATCAVSSSSPRPERARRLLLLAATEGSGAGAGEEGPRRSAFDAVVEGLVSMGLGRRWRAGGGELVADDKRRVPTGPNPLHNR